MTFSIFLLLCALDGVFVRYWKRMNLGAATHLPNLKNTFLRLFKSSVSAYFIGCVTCEFIYD